MSLLLYVDQCPEPFETNVEKVFDMIRLNDTTLNRKIIASIEQGTFNDSTSFIDRFGYKLPIDDLSTGCKAALCVINQQQVVSLAECGFNAINVILKLQLSGKAFIYDNCVALGERNGSIDVVLDNKRFVTTTELNNYLHNERYLLSEHFTDEVKKICI